jgi:homoserine kinase
VPVEVPASSANLGPGFDALAVALDLRLRVEAVPREERRVVAAGDGADELPAGDDNLIWRALVAFCAWAGVAVPDVSLRSHNAIPLERGLGSSAAAAVAGVVLARALTGAPAADGDLTALAADLEGHPDNAAAAVLGGLVVALDGRARRLTPTPALRPVVCVPTARQSTEAARGLLPAAVPLPDAAANAARAALVVAGLAGALALDPAAMTDVLHEPVRLAAMPATGRLVRALRDEGVAACLSGSGPTVLAVVPARDDDAVAAVSAAAGDGWAVTATRWNHAGATVI